MSKYKHHSSFPKEKAIQSYLFPHVCFNCRKSFKKPISEEPRRCPQCAGEMIRLSRKFSTPSAVDDLQWKKVQLLVEHGFLFQSVYIPSAYGGRQKTDYPATLEQAHEFVITFKEQAFDRSS